MGAHQSKVATLSKLSSKHIDTSKLGYFALLPLEIIWQIISKVDLINCLPLTIAFRSFRESFTSTVVHLSNQQKPDSNLTHLCYEFCDRFSSFPKVIPQFLTLNSDQLVDHQKKMLPMHGLVFNCSEMIPLLDDALELPILIRFPNFSFFQNAIECSMKYIKKVLTCKNYSKVKRLVLENLVYSSKLIELLNTKFDGLEYLNITSFNPKSDFDQDVNILSKFTTISELEITLPTLSHFSFCPPIQLKKCTINTLQSNSTTGTGRMQMINIVRSTSLEILIIKRNPDDGLDSLYMTYSPIPCLKNLISNTNGKYLSQHNVSDLYLSQLTTDDRKYLSQLKPGDGWYSNLRIIHVSKGDRFPFLVRSPDGKLSLIFDMVPACEEFGVVDEFGKLHIIWKKQL
jgi:hypothetical protein